MTSIRPQYDLNMTSISFKVNLSGDAMITVLCMVRAMLNPESAADKQLPTWLKEYPVTLTQVRSR